MFKATNAREVIQKNGTFAITSTGVKFKQKYIGINRTILTGILSALCIFHNQGNEKVAHALFATRSKLHKS